MKSPIKYYGGKSYMTDIILKQFPTNYKIYVEGFGGGASVLFAKPKTDLEVYNDLGENVYSLFHVLNDKEKFQRLKERLELTYYSEELRQEFKKDLKGKLDIEDRAYKFIYVNRTSFNGVGGFSTSLIVRRNMSKSTSDYLSMIDRLPEIHNRLSSVIVEHKDIFDLLDKYDSEDTFLYADPPYLHELRSSTTSYEHELSNEQHIRLYNRLNEFKGKVLLSGYDDFDICKILDKKFTKMSFKSPNANSDSTETLWRNYEIQPLKSGTLV